MATTTAKYRCTECSADHLRWQGKCNNCGEYSTVEEVVVAAASTVGLTSSTTIVTPAQPAPLVADIVTAEPPPRLTTGIGEFDRVMGGGLTPSFAAILAGLPGSGKSTLALHVAHQFAEKHGPVLYASGEESIHQIGLRAQRLGITTSNIRLSDDTDIHTILGHIDAHEPQLVIADSVQTLASADVTGRAGGTTQVIEVATLLTRTAKHRNIALIMIGQTTKGGEIAGPQALAHLVDAVAVMEGDPHSTLRLLRCEKNRFGAVDELGAFEHTDTGLQEVPDPSALFRSHRTTPTPGACITITMEGRRALLAEVQALIAHTNAPAPRRSVSGLDSARIAMLAAVTERATRKRLSDKDVFASALGGMKITDPGADLAACLALASAATNTPIAASTVAIGEVTLAAELRSVPMMKQRLDEAARMGYTTVIAPPGTRELLSDDTVTVIETTELSHAITAALTHTKGQ